MSPRGWLRRLGLGRFLYAIWHGPRGFIRRILRTGPLNAWLTRRGHDAMIRAARTLPPTPVSTNPGDPAVRFLTGRKYWDQTLFCAQSLLACAGRPLRVIVYDDGSLSATDQGRLTRGLPGVMIVSQAEVLDRLNRALPESRFPALRQRRIVYPHLRKLTDVHAGDGGWKLVLDSDMLFFRRPDHMLEWLEHPDKPYFLLDAEQSYGYSEALMAELAGAPVAARMNVGACGLNGDAIDWDQLETWCRIMLEREGSSYLQEQALSAMLAAGKPTAVAPETDYIVLPGRQEVERPTAALHHYVADSKSWYFRFGWRQVRGIR